LKVATLVGNRDDETNPLARRRFLPTRTGRCLTAPLAVLAVLALAACATDVANRYYGSVNYPAKNPQDVEILWRAPTREYVVIADFQSRGETPEAMREKAAKIGADAVIVSILGGQYSRSEEWAAADRYAQTYSRITGTALKYK
jgi:hypothetical protein